MPDSIQQRLREDRLLNPDYATRLEAATLIDQAVEALTEARDAIASLPQDALGEVNLPDGWTGEAMLYPIRDEMLAKIDATLVSISGLNP